MMDKQIYIEEKASIIRLQDSILQVSTESVPSIITEIVASNYNNNEQIPYLFNFLLIAAEIRPKKIEMIADICVSLSWESELCSHF